MTLVIENLSKSFAAPVLTNVSLRIEPGCIHGLVGENGAGKSTLINILMGLLSKDAGKITLDECEYQPSQVSDAFAVGFSLAAQELSLIDYLSVAENILLKALPSRRGLLHQDEIQLQARYWAEAIGLDPSLLLQRVAHLSLAQKQQVELAKALATASRLLILDEPTAALTEPQAEQLHRVIRDCANRGMAVIYVSHRLQDVLRVCDTVSVLRNGEIEFTQSSSTLSVPILIEAMSGSTRVESKTHNPQHKGELLLSVDNMMTKDLPNPIEFKCHRGEIVGVAGLAGSGRSELLMAIYGLTKLTKGSVNLHRGENKIPIRSAHQAVSLGMGLVAEDRKSQGIFADKSIAFNMVIASLRRVANSWGILRSSVEKKLTEALIQELGVKCDHSAQAIARLSGGNQQKILIGRWLHAQADVILLDEPTRGVDQNAKQLIYEKLHDWREKGALIIIVSSEIDELTSLCDRIVVLSNRKQVATFSPHEWSREKILNAAFSAYN